jgi:hypothetical protein
MSHDLASLRHSLALARRSSRFYPAGLRHQVRALALAHGASFHSCSAFATTLGLPLATLRSWLRHAPAEPSQPAFLPVVVRRDDSPAFTLLLPGGARVEGLSLDHLAALCQRVAS